MRPISLLLFTIATLAVASPTPLFIPESTSHPCELYTKDQLVFTRNAASPFGYVCDPGYVHEINSTNLSLNYSGQDSMDLWSDIWQQAYQCNEYELPVLVFGRQDHSPRGFVCSYKKIQQGPIILSNDDVGNLEDSPESVGTGDTNIVSSNNI